MFLTNYHFFILILICKSAVTTSFDICLKCQCWKPSNNKKTIYCADRNIHINDLEHINITEKNLALSFANNNIGHLKKVPKITQSYSLSLKNCSISKIDPYIFLDATTITYLDLSNNLIHYEDIYATVFQGPYGSKFYEPINLIDLNLANNFLISLESNIFEHTPYLKHLDLSSNSLTNFIDVFEAIRPLKFLRNVILKNNSLAEPITLENYEDDVVLESVKYLDISYNDFETVPKYFCTMFPSLETFVIDGNLMEELNDESFLGFNKLTELHISNMPKLRRINHNTFTNLPELRTLYLNHNRNLVHINMLTFGAIQNKHPPITELYINDNNLRELNESLLNWTALSIFDYSGNHWMCQCNEKASVHCNCKEVETRMIFMKDFEQKPIEPSKSWGVGRIILSITVASLCFVAGIFFWKILLKYRNIRSVNSDYPVFYTTVPTVLN